jgi:hypothetical protein
MGLMSTVHIFMAQGPGPSGHGARGLDAESPIHRFFGIVPGLAGMQIGITLP